MTDPNDILARARRRRASPWVVAGAWLAALVIVSVLDAPLWRALSVADRAGMEGADWYKALRSAGFLPAWLLVAACVLLHDVRRGAVGPGPSAPARGLAVALGPAIAGAAAEVAKAAMRRHRPHGDGSYTFAWWDDVPGVGIGTVSSHAAVAFGGAFVLARVFPGVRWPVLALACGCGLTRLLSGAHFASDVLAGAILGYYVAWGVCRLIGADGARTP